MFQLVLRQIMEVQPGYETDSGRQPSQVDDVIPLTDDKFRVVNAIFHPLRQHDLGEGSLLRAVNSPTHSESSNGSWDPLRELYAIEGETAPTEDDLKRREDKETHRLQ